MVAPHPSKRPDDNGKATRNHSARLNKRWIGLWRRKLSRIALFQRLRSVDDEEATDLRVEVALDGRGDGRAGRCTTNVFEIHWPSRPIERSSRSSSILQ